VHSGLAESNVLFLQCHHR